MSPKRREFTRAVGTRNYRKLFVIAVEGIKTEPQYFAFFNNPQSVIRVKCLRGKTASSSPEHVLKLMKDYLKKENLKADDEAWLIVDRDQWLEEQLALLYKWSLQNNNHHFALSNPKFEYWLLLHFEDGASIESSNDCSNRLKRYLKRYDKGIEANKITLPRIKEAVRRAKLRDTPPCEDWPRKFGTTVYRLVQKLIQQT